jgi:hypothetical protein
MTMPTFSRPRRMTITAASGTTDSGHHANLARWFALVYDRAATSLVGLLAVLPLLATLGVSCATAPPQRPPGPAIERHDEAPDTTGISNAVSQPGPSPCAGIATCRRRLYVAGEGQAADVKVYDVDKGHAHLEDLRPGGGDYKGLAAHAGTGHLYLSSRLGDQVIAFDLLRQKVTWRKAVGSYVDRLTVAPDGRTLFVPLRREGVWVALSTSDGAVLERIRTTGKPHNTIAMASGRIYMTALGSPWLTVIDRDAPLVRVGPFGGGIRPFVIDAAEERSYVNIDGLLGFEIGDLKTGRKLHRVEVQGFPAPARSYHGTPSHGVALTPDGREVWVANAGGFVHVFDNTLRPPRQIVDLPMSGDVGWITFSIDGRFAYPSTGEVVEVTTRRTVGHVRASEKQIEIALGADRVVAVGDQFGIGRAR